MGQAYRGLPHASSAAAVANPGTGRESLWGVRLKACDDSLTNLGLGKLRLPQLI
jgi:hypothetical protein